MATVACPGCGLPRAESEVGNECPVCHAAPVFAPAPQGRRARPTEPDPTAGLPADASELGSATAVRPPARGMWIALGVGLFALGTLSGAVGVLGWQALGDTPIEGNVPEVVRKPDEPPPPSLPPPPEQPKPQARVLAVAPMPHEPGAVVVRVEPTLAPMPRTVVPGVPPWQVTTIDVGQHPPDIYTLPFPLKTGQHVILRGKVKTLKVSMLDAGAILDASQLEAGAVTISGKIDGRSTLKLYVPNGTVSFSGKVDNGSVVEINAPGGDVRFTAQTTATKEGAKIDNGSRVSITARAVEFKGDIAGANTKVSVVLTRNAWLKVASVSGKAAVEYKAQAAGWSPPDVIVGTVGPDATFRKAGE